MTPLFAPASGPETVCGRSSRTGGRWAVSYALARLAELRGSRDEAHRLYDAAVAACEQIGATATRARVARARAGF